MSKHQAPPQAGDRDALHELAHVERKLHESTVIDHEVIADDSGARLWFDTWAPNPAFRGEIVAGICSEVAASESWGLVRVHDPLERENGTIQAGVTVRREGDDA